MPPRHCLCATKSVIFGPVVLQRLVLGSDSILATAVYLVLHGS